MKTESIKSAIKKSYGDIATGKTQVSCCSEAVCCSNDDLRSMTEDYSKVAGYYQEADLALGCGLPTEIAGIRQGDTVVDLGSGAGNDAFIARNIVGESGKIIGIDMTPEMVIRALQNNQKLGYNNVEFMLGEIENMTGIANDIADVVISNCVMNLVPDKQKAFAEISRVLKVGGHFSISDIVHTGTLPAGILKAAEMYAGCVAGASERGAYLGIIKSAGFKNIAIKKERSIILPDDLLLKYVSEEELAAYKNSRAGLYSITIYADKLEAGACCDASNNSCCGSEKSDATIKASCCEETANACCS